MMLTAPRRGPDPGGRGPVLTRGHGRALVRGVEVLDHG